MKLHNAFCTSFSVIAGLPWAVPKYNLLPSVMVVIVKYFLLAPDALSCLDCFFFKMRHASWAAERNDSEKIT